jgi:hypothetical protein
MTPTPEEVEKVAEEMRKVVAMRRSDNPDDTMAEWLEARASRLSPPKAHQHTCRACYKSGRHAGYCPNGSVVAKDHCTGGCEEGLPEPPKERKTWWAPHDWNSVDDSFVVDNRPIESGAIKVRIIPADRFAEMEEAIRLASGWVDATDREWHRDPSEHGKRLRAAWAKFQDGGGE